MEIPYTRKCAYMNCAAVVATGGNRGIGFDRKVIPW